MGRTAVQNQALGDQVAALFLEVLRGLVGANVFTVDGVREHEYALVRVDRKDLWRLYMAERYYRTTAGRAVYDARTSGDAAAEAKAQHEFHLHAFLARAMVAPASALRGRALFWIVSYAEEGITHAAKLIQDPVLVGTWSARIDSLKGE